MSKFDFSLKFKDVKVIKHSLEKRIENDKPIYELLKEYGTLNEESIGFTDEEKAFIKEHEEHSKCLENFIEQMKRTGERHGRNVFGNNYNYWKLNRENRSK